MQWTTVQLENLPLRPWANGAGLTRELLVSNSNGDWDWRVSVAEVTRDCAFSSFHGIDRHITVLRGTVMELTIDGYITEIRADGEILAFPGEATTTCRLPQGPTLDLNVMLRRGKVKAHMQRLRGAISKHMLCDAVVLLYDIPRERFQWARVEEDEGVSVRSTNGIWVEIYAANA